MLNINRNFPVVAKQAVQKGLYQVQVFSQKIWVRLAFLGLLALILTQKEFSFQFSIGGAAAQAINTNPGFSGQTRGFAQPINLVDTEESAPLESPQTTAIISETTTEAKTNTAPEKTYTGKMWWEDIRDKGIDVRDELNLANAATAVGEALTEEQKKKAAQFSNLGFALNPGYAKKHGIDPAIEQAKNQVCLDYIAKYAKTAQEEAELYNIPASITLAQGLLESNAGDSKLAAKDNNHFGMKCKKKCVGCRCANYTDDSKFDMFRVFETSWESFREHSKLLTGKRYKHLLQLPRSDYRNWAHGLKAAGYATDKRYGDKLISIIEVFDLSRFDR